MVLYFFKKQIVSISVSFALIIIPAVRSLLASLTLQTWTPEEAILQRSYELARSALLWGGASTPNSTVANALAEKYGSTVTLTAMCFGVFGILLDFCGFLQFYASWYLLLIVAASMSIITINFESSFPSRRAWEFLRDVQALCRNLDKIFGIVFKLLHLNNTMVLAYFLLNMFIKAEYDVYLFLTFLDTTLLVLGYYVAGKVAAKV